MLPVRRILAPTDFSPRSYPAIDVAVELAQHFSAELLVVHVLTPIPDVVPGAGAPMPVNMTLYRDSLAQDTEQALATLVSDRVPSDVKTVTLIAWGPPPQTIVDTADEQSADLVVICTRGATGLSRFVSGSVTEKVVRLADVPVLTVQSSDDA